MSNCVEQGDVGAASAMTFPPQQMLASEKVRGVGKKNLNPSA